MDRLKHLDTAAGKLLNVLDRHSQGLPATEVDAKWSALAKVVAKAETRAKRQELRKLLRPLNQSR